MNSKTNMNNNDYIQILNYYKEHIPKSKRLIQTNAENILAQKLCRCIKKVDNFTDNEPKSIGICTKTIFNRKRLTRGKFTCKGKSHVSFKKTRKNRSKK
jgi:hypothetical protein